MSDARAVPGVLIAEEVLDASPPKEPQGAVAARIAAHDGEVQARDLMCPNLDGGRLSQIAETKALDVVLACAT